MSLSISPKFLGVVVCLLAIGAKTGLAQVENGPPMTNGASAESGVNTTITGDRIGGGSGKARPKSAAAGRREIAPVALIGSVATPSPANSFALSGSYAYVCNNNEIAVVNTSNPSAMQIVGTATATIIQNSGAIHCAVERNTLAVFTDQTGSAVGNTPGFVAFGLTNPAAPQLIQATSINKRFFQKPVYIGNYAFVPTAAREFFFGGWETQRGDLLSFNLTNFSAPALVDTLQEPQVHAVYGAESPVLGATRADTNLIYIGGSTSTGPQNNGKGRLQVVDVSNPAAMKTVAQRLVPGSIHLYAPLVNGNVAVGIGNTGGYIEANVTSPIQKGNIVVAVFDITERQAPEALSISTSTYKVGPGGGATRIGQNLYAFAGVQDAAGNNVLLVVDASNPLSPILDHIPIPQPFASIEADGTRLYAAQGAGGFAVYSIPGIQSPPASSCPVFTDAMLVVDRGAAMPAQAFADAKGALSGFVDNFRQPSDQVGVASFTTSGTVHQTLALNPALAKTALAGLVQGGSSYIGAGIDAARDELKGPRGNGSALPVMVILSDGADLGAPNATATLAAATAAKAAGIKIISVQYGATANPLMQAIASSSADFHLVSP